MRPLPGSVRSALPASPSLPPAPCCCRRLPQQVLIGCRRRPSCPYAAGLRRSGGAERRGQQPTKEAAGTLGRAPRPTPLRRDQLLPTCSPVNGLMECVFVLFSAESLEGDKSSCSGLKKTLKTPLIKQTSLKHPRCFSPEGLALNVLF